MVILFEVILITSENMNFIKISKLVKKEISILNDLIV